MVETRSRTRDQGGNSGSGAAQGPRARRVAAVGETSQLSSGVSGAGSAPTIAPPPAMQQHGGSLADKLHLIFCAAGIIASLMLYSVLQVRLPVTLPRRIHTQFQHLAV